MTRVYDASLLLQSELQTLDSGVATTVLLVRDAEPASGRPGDLAILMCAIADERLQQGPPFLLPAR
jgi:hypothetical protein